MDVYVPPDWPREVAVPGSDDWEATAVSWLLGLVPEYGEHATVVRHPVILASIARHVLTGAVEGARHGYRTVRTELSELAPPHAVDAALVAYRAQGFEMSARVRAVILVERALRGETFTEKMS